MSFERRGVELRHIPRPRRLGRSRRRTELRGHPGAAGGRRAGRHPRHRAGRGDRRQISQSRARPAEPRPPRRGDARGGAAAPAGAGRRVPSSWPRWRSCPPTPTSAYRALVYETPGFERYFWESTVIGEIANLHIGSRPASRKKSTRVEDLRAIPWVFGWAQCRLMLPAWYGFGAAVTAWTRGATRGRHGAAAGDGARMAVLPDAAVEHGHGAGEERHRHRLALQGAGGGCAIAGSDLCPAVRRMGEFQAGAALDPRPARAAGAQSRAGAHDPRPLSLHRSAQPRAARAA